MPSPPPSPPNSTLCRDLADVLDMSSNITQVRPVDRQLRDKRVAAAMRAVQRVPGERDRDVITQALHMLSAEANQGSAYMAWVAHVLGNAERTWCEDRNTTRRSARRDPRSPRTPVRRLMDEFERISPRLSPRSSPRALVPRTPTERRSRAKLNVRDMRYKHVRQKLKETLVRSVDGVRRTSPRAGTR